MEKMRFLSLCSGIGGIDLAAEWAGMEVVGQVEIDPFCNQVLEKHWPHVKRMGDIRQVVGDEFGAVHLVAGGIPCQPFSTAGKRRGSADDRYLWPEMLRVVRVTHPDVILVENVAGFVKMALDTVSADLEGDGYETRAFVLPAAAVGAPHQRERCFLVAISRRFGHHRNDLQGRRDMGDKQRPGTPTTEESVGQERRSGTGTTGANVADASRERRQPGRRGGGPETLGEGENDEATDGGKGVEYTQREGLPQRRQRTTQQTDQPARATARKAQSRLGGATHGLPDWLDGARWPALPSEAQYDWEAPRTVTGQPANRVARVKALGNAVVPAQVYPILAAIAEIWSA